MVLNAVILGAHQVVLILAHFLPCLCSAQHLCSEAVEEGGREVQVRKRPLFYPYVVLSCQQKVMAYDALTHLGKL